MNSKYLKIIICSIITFWMFKPMNAIPNPLIGEKWVIIGYNNPFDGVPISFLNKSTNTVDCSNYYVLEFFENGRFQIRLNQKMTSRGRYTIKKQDIKFKIYIDEGGYDRDTECKLSSIDCLILNELLWSTKSYKTDQDNLILFFTHTRSKTEGTIELVKLSKLN